VAPHVTDWVHLRGPRNNHNEPSPRRAVYDDPATGEDYLVAHGIRNMLDMGAAMARPHKGASLLGVIIDFAIDGGYLDFDNIDVVLTSLLAEPELRLWDLLAMTRSMRGRVRTSPALLATICSHPLADEAVFVGALWNAKPDVARAVAERTGSLLPAAIGWVRRSRENGYASPNQLARVSETAARWGDLTEGDPGLVSFIITSAHAFTDESELFAVGRALVAAPGAP